MQRRIIGWAVLGLLVSGVAAAGGGFGHSWHWTRPSRDLTRLSPETVSSPRPARGLRPNPAPSLITSVAVHRPAPLEVTVIASPPREQLGLAEPPPVCDAAPRTLLRAGCPEGPPELAPCAEEGRECRYPAADECVAHYECLYGFWSAMGVHCPDADPGEVLAGSGTCEERTPVPDAPCADEGISCGHHPCGIGGLTELVAECRCGRWYQRWQGCPLTR
jgi:hypothetical protein